MKMIRATFFAAAITSTATGLSAQSVTRDPATGDYLVQYSVDGNSRTVRVAARDRVNPSIELRQLESVAGGWRYTYTVSNRPGGQAENGKGFRMVDLDCPPDAAQSGAAVGQPQGWRVYGSVENASAPVCMFRGANFLEPGDSISGLTLTSATLPMIGSAEVYGKATIPVVEDEVVPDTVSALLGTLGVKGFVLLTVLPGRPLSTVATASAAVSSLRSDLAQVCGSLAWLQNAGTCRSLQAKLDAVTAALARGQSTTAKNQLNAFNAELAAQREQHITDGAYFLLHALSERALSLL